MENWVTIFNDRLPNTKVKQSKGKAISSVNVSSLNFNFSKKLMPGQPSPQPQQVGGSTIAMHERKSLQTITTNETNNRHTTVPAKTSIKDCNIPIYHDKVSKSTQTEKSPEENEHKEEHSKLSKTVKKDGNASSPSTSNDAANMLTQDDPGEHFWRDLAEERRKQILVVTQENKKLVHSIEALKRENSALMKVQEKFTELQNVLQDLLPEGGGEETEEEQD